MAIVVLAALALAACDDLAAPTTRGVCWRLIAPPSRKPRFQQVASGVWSLDDCAVELESFHLLGAAQVEGAFTSAPSRNGFRYPIFQPSQRREIDADLRRLIKERDGALPDASAISVERR
jgi:hypothetical protein